MSLKDSKRSPRSSEQASQGPGASPKPGVAPGRRTRTQGLPPGPAGRGAPVQRKPDPLADPLADPAHQEQAALTDRWIDTAVRPDLHPPPVQRKGTGGPAAHDAAATAGSGQAMPAAVQAKMEHAFGADFSAVRIHQSDQATAVGALAYTQGSDIHFAPGQYDPHGPQGQALLGHELTHVVQQSQGRVRASTQAKGLPVNEDPALEREADVLGERAARGEQVSVPGSGGGPGRPPGSGRSQLRGGGGVAQRMRIPGAAKDSTELGAAELGETGGSMPMDIDTDSERETGRAKQPGTTVAYALLADKSGEPYQNVAENVTGAGSRSRAPVHDTAYIAQVPTHVGGEPPAAVAAKYEREAFDDPSHAQDRLRLAVGVNSYRDVADANRGAVADLVKAASSKVRMAAVGFLWEPMWQKTIMAEGQPVATQTMKASDVAADPDARSLGASYFSRKEMDRSTGVTRQGKVPYGRIRDHIKNHRLTVQLTAELYNVYKNVFVHVGDDDAKQLKEKPGRGVGTRDGGEALGLLSRYDAILDQEQGQGQEQAQEDTPALLASGGYEFRRQGEGGDIADGSEAAEITLMANRLDREIRVILASELGPLAVYFPEPNTIYRVTEENTRLDEGQDEVPIFHDPNDTTGGGSGESQQMVANLLRLNPDGRAVYDPRASVVTETSGRFAEGEGTYAKHLQAGTVDPTLIKHLVGQNQSHASRHTWLDSVGQHNKLDAAARQDKLPATFVRAVFDAFIVTRGDFDRKARAKPTAQELKQWLDKTLDEPPGEAAIQKQHQKYLATETGKQVVAAAKRTNGRIVEAIHRTLQRIAAKHDRPITILGHDDKGGKGE